MISKITSNTMNVCNALYEKAPSVNQIVKNVNKVALVAVALVAATHAQGAEGGVWFGSATLLACLPLIECPPLFTACCVAAAGAYAAPTP